MPATMVNDAPLYFDRVAHRRRKPWEPKNFDGTLDGPMPLRRALAEVEEHGDASACCSRSARPMRRTGSAASASTADKHPGLPADGARRRLGHADADGRPRTRCSPTAAIASAPSSSRASPTTKARCCSESTPPSADESATRHPGAQCLRHELAAAQRDDRRHRPQGAGRRSSATTSTARPAPPTTPSTPGSPASSRRASASPGSATTRRASWASAARPAAAWPCRSGSATCRRRCRGVAVCRDRPRRGVVQAEGEWCYDEFGPGGKALVGAGGGCADRRAPCRAAGAGGAAGAQPDPRLLPLKPSPAHQRRMSAAGALVLV